MNNVSATRLSAIGQISMTAQDVTRATAFYRDRLGVRFLFEFPNLAFFDCGGVRLMITKPEKPEFDHPGSVLYFKVDDIDAAYADLAGKGVEFVESPHLVARMPDHELWLAGFKDSEGNTLALMQEKRF